ncbi:MAG: threonine--tRNA ligase [Patescibacteria group bacterium]
MSKQKKHDDQLSIMRHSVCHLMSMAVQEIYPQVGLGVGPSIEDGFYQDYGLPRGVAITPEMLPKLEKRIKEMIKEGIEFKQHDVDFIDAYKFYKHDPYKTGFIDDLKAAGEKKVSFYKSGWFDNLCAGPHVKSTEEIDPEGFKLTKIAGAYWRGDEKNDMLTRVYGVAFNSKKELEEYLKMQEEAEKRDHRKLGQELGLFILDEQVGQGLPLWLPNGAILCREIEQFALNEYLRRDYQLVKTPHIGSEKLFNISGHLDFYKDGMYSPIKIEDELYYLKPMNCPMHLRIYQHEMRSYRDLPIRYTEMGTVYRYERSGTLHGLTRVRGFTQDDAHIICTPEQLEDEVVKVLKLSDFILKTFGFDNLKVVLSVRDPENKEKYLGSDQDWQMAEKSLVKALKVVGWPHVVEEGEAVFYGPKIDIKASDAIGREWQLSTIQFDFNLPGKFDINYIDEQGKKKRPLMIHRALLGSLERFIGVLIEHYAGAFPVWLSPAQVKIISVGSAHIEYCQRLVAELRLLNIRAAADDANETVGKKIRQAEKERVPYMLVIGDKEMGSDKLNVRIRGQKEVQQFEKSEFIKRVLKEINERTKELK